MSEEKDLSRAVVDAAVTEKPGVYLLGPTLRVDFASQQRRALNLVLSLAEQELIAKGDRVAVVGAGIAGLTVAAGLQKLKCDVTIFEPASSIMHQERTSHRYVHPTINSWPGEPLSATTELPFFDWYGAPCHVVCDAIEREWKRDADVKLLLGRRVIAVENRGNGAVLVTAVPGDSFGEFRAVIIVDDFGKEDDCGFSGPSYWESDDLDLVIAKNELKYLIVCGTGDGGLVDALRAVHTDFRNGELPVEVASELSYTALADVIRDAEESLQQAGSDNPSRSQIVYLEAAKRLAEEAIYRPLYDRLNASLKARIKVLLMDERLSHPFSPQASPINKLLLAHAISRGAAEFRQGKPALDGDDLLVGQNRIPRSAARVIVRQAPSCEYTHLFKTLDLGQHQAKASALQRRLPIIGRRDALQGIYRFSFHNPDEPNFIESRLDLAREVARRNFDGDLCAEPSRFRLISARNPLARIPRKIFGIPLEAIAEISSDTGTGNTKPFRAIISFGSSDKAVAGKIIKAFKNADIEVLADEFQPGSADLLTDRADIDLAPGDIVLPLVSKSSLSSDWVQIGLASLLSSSQLRDRAITLHPLIIDDVALPDSLRNLKSFDLSHSPSNRIKAAVEQLSAVRQFNFSGMSTGDFEDVTLVMLESLGLKIISPIGLGRQGGVYEALLNSNDSFGSTVEQRWIAVIRHSSRQHVDLRAVREIMKVGEDHPALSGCVLVTSGRLTSVARDLAVSLASKSRFQLRIVDQTELRTLFISRSSVRGRRTAEAFLPS